jgi:hypothetical protein
VDSETVRPAARDAVARAEDPDARTRDRVATAVLQDGPVTASAIAEKLGTVNHPDHDYGEGD